MEIYNSYQNALLSFGSNSIKSTNSALEKVLVHGGGRKYSFILKSFWGNKLKRPHPPQALCTCMQCLLKSLRVTLP